MPIGTGNNGDSLMHRSLSVPVLYRTLFQIATMRKDVAGLGAEVDPNEADRFFARLSSLEQQAADLLQCLEMRNGRVSH